MIMSPIQTTDAKPLLNKSNPFGANPSLYAGIKFNGQQLKGHEGIDIVVPTGTLVFAPIEGVVTVVDSGKTGYGLHVIITNDRFKIYLGHLSEVFVKSGDFVPLLNKVAKSGNSGHSSGAHLHMTVLRMRDGRIQNVDNGYGGAIDVTEFIATWKGSLTKDLIL